MVILDAPDRDTRGGSDFAEGDVTDQERIETPKSG
jgi:hypothetical protein